MTRDAEDLVKLIGKLGSAPEIKPTANGQMLTLNLGVQVVSWANDDAGQRKPSERTTWHRVVSFNPRIIRCAEGLEKDDIVAVRGYLDHRTYEKDGQQLFITEFVAEELDPIRAKRLPPVIPSPPPADTRPPGRKDMLRITVELLPAGREDSAVVISRGTLPISNVTGLIKAVDGFGGRST